MENTRKRYVLAIIFVILSALGFSALQMLVRLSPDIPVHSKIFFRNFVILVITGTIMLINGISFKVPKSERKILFLRAFAGTASVYMNFYALKYVYLSDSTIIQKLVTFMLLILSYIFLKEKFTKTQFIGLLISFIGVMFVIKPGSSSFNIFHLLVLVATFGSAIAYLCVRMLGVRNIVNPLHIVLYFSVLSCVVSLPFAIRSHVDFSPRNILILLGIGIFGCLGQYSLTYAYRLGSSREISVFDYTQVLFSSILGIVFLNEIPDVYSIVGYVIIVSVAIWMYMVNRRGGNSV